MRISFLSSVFVLTALAAAGQPAPPLECAEYPAKLESCSPYTCTFTHPFTGQPMQRRIVGLDGDRCAYVEQMPNGGSMECSYTASMRKDMADFVRLTYAADSVQGRMRTGSEGTTTSTAVDGQKVRNPLDEALRSGACRVTGYGSGRSSTGPAPRRTTPEPSRPDSPAPPPPTSAEPPPTRSASGTPALGASSGGLTLSGRAVPLDRAYAFPAPSSAGGSPDSILLVLSDQPLTAQQALAMPELEKLMGDRKLHGVTAVVDLASKTVHTMHVYDPTHRYAVFVAPSNRRLDITSAEGAAVAGRLSTIRPGAFAGAPYEVSVAFNASVQR
jgi:hypothetical protein